MSKANRCPVCDGKGIVPAGFYSYGNGSTSTADETCRSCKGTGYVVVPEDIVTEKKGKGILNG